MAQITLTGENLTIEDLVHIARAPQVKVGCTAEALERVSKCADAVKAIAENEDSNEDPCYGVNTGFGEFKTKRIPKKEDRIKLQRNLLLSHSVGVGENTNPEDLANYYPSEVIRAVLAIRINAFLKGHSGVRKELVDFLVEVLNAGIIPLVPLRGSVGASGDLCPLAHLFSTLLLGKGRYYTTGDRQIKDASSLPLEKLPKEPVSYKEGLALTNGATFSAAMLALAVYDAERIADTADVCAALTLEALGGFSDAFDEKIHKVRPFEGQKRSAETIRKLIKDSQFTNKFPEYVQDAYSLRCAPQVHGASRDAIAYARRIAEIEINSATDNPLFFQENEHWKAYSGGNFHGQPIALAADFLTIALAELASISERRIQMLLDGAHNRKLPANLAGDPGLESGLMIAQYTAASLVSENKVLAHPASVDSIPTSANSEDHVSMSSIAARKLRTVLGNVSSVLAIELMVAAQAVELRSVDPQSKSKPSKSKTAAKLGAGTRSAYKKVRDQVKQLVEDRPLDEDIRKIRCLIEEGQFEAGRLLPPDSLNESTALT